MGGLARAHSSSDGGGSLTVADGSRLDLSTGRISVVYLHVGNPAVLYVYTVVIWTGSYLSIDLYIFYMLHVGQTRMLPTTATLGLG